MSARPERRGGIGILNQLILLVFLGALAIIAIAYLLSPSSPFKSAPPAPAPVTIGQIQKLYRLQTAQVAGSTIVEGQTNSALPFSKATLSYQVIITMTAGVDLSKLKDSDIQPDGDTLNIYLPPPEILSESSDFTPVAESKQILAGPSEKKELPKMVVDEGKKRVRQSIMDQGILMRDARINAEDQIRNLIFQIAPQYRRVIFLQTPLASPSPAVSPKPSGPPR